MTKDEFISVIEHIAWAIETVLFDSKVYVKQFDVTQEQGVAACYKPGVDPVICVHEKYMDSEFFMLVLNIFHELVHAYNVRYHTRDYEERDGTQWHNGCFKWTAEKHGARCEYYERYGWAAAYLPPETIAKIKEVYDIIKGESLSNVYAHKMWYM